MKPTPFDGSGPNRSGIRQVPLSSDRFSGYMLRGLGRAIDRSRVVSSPDAIIRETPGGTSIETNLGEPLHLFPFRVDVLALKGGKIRFRVEEGRVFGATQEGGAFNFPPFSVAHDSYVVRFHESITATTELSPAPEPGKLDNRNLYTLEANLEPVQETVIFVDIRRNSFASPWTVELRVESRPHAEALSVSNPIVCQYIKEINLGPAGIHAPFIQSHEAEVTLGTTIVLTQESSLYEIESGFLGSAQIPVAFVKPSGEGDFQLFQVLRSDIFFPYSVNIVMRYVDTGVTGLTGNETDIPGGEC